MKQNGFFCKIKNDSIYRGKFALVFTFIWSILMTAYYALASYLIIKDQDKFIWSWYLSLAVWWFVIVLFKFILLILSSKINKPKYIDFNLLIILFLFINLAEIIVITITPSIFAQAYASKLNKGVTISSLVISVINLVLFIISFIMPNKDRFTFNEAGFITAGKIIGRMSGIFNILLIVIHTLLLLQFYYPQILDTYIAYTYLGIGVIFEIMSIVLIVKYIKKRKSNK